MRLVAVATLSLFVTLPAFAADQPAADPKTAPKLVCKRIEKTGSHLGSDRICLTQEQWDAQNKAARDSVHQSQLAGPTKNTGGK